MRAITRSEWYTATETCRRLLIGLAAICALGLIVGDARSFAETVTTQQVTTVTTQPAVDDASVWIGRNISAFVNTFGQPSYWSGSHDGGGGGGRYIYDNPNQPHFVLETQPGGIIVRAVRVP